MHDTADLESRGVPSVFVASSAFADAADAQCRSIGLEVARVFVPHPIQDRTDDEMRALADASLPAVLRAIGGSSAP